jgi:hypothetical protein
MQQRERNPDNELWESRIDKLKNHMQHLPEAQQCCFVPHVADAEPDLASPGVRFMLVEYNYSLNLIMLHAAKSI